MCCYYHLDFNFLSVSVNNGYLYNRGPFSGAKPLVTLNTIKSIRKFFIENEIYFEGKLRIRGVRKMILYSHKIYR